MGYEGQPKSTLFVIKSLRLARPLQPGFVFTVEPGIYFIPELISRWKAERNFEDFICYDRLEAYRDFGGIGIEENVVMTSAAEPLAKSFLRTLNRIRAAGLPESRN